MRKEHKRNADRRHKWDGEHSGLREGLLQTYRSAFEVPEQEQRDRRDQKLEHLCRLVRDLELEVQGRHQRRNHNESPKGLVSAGVSYGEASRQSGSHLCRDRSRDFANRDSVSPEWCRH